jgi:hypothetical protein
MTPTIRLRCSLAFLFLGCALLDGVKSTIQYIDDQLGDSVTGVVPSYTPPSAWDTVVAGCSSCDPSQLPFNDTYMQSQSSDPHSPPRLITFNFVGE